MKKYIALVLAFAMILCSCKKSDDSSSETDTTTTSSTTAVTTVAPDISQENTLESEPPMVPMHIQDSCFMCHGTIHSFKSFQMLYNGILDDFDYSMLDGYVFVGQTYESKEQLSYQSHDLEHYDFVDGLPILYNAEKGSYIFWEQTGSVWVKVCEHVCTEENCHSVADQ